MEDVFNKASCILHLIGKVPLTVTIFCYYLNSTFPREIAD